jgi:transposase-like protein
VKGTLSMPHKLDHLTRHTLHPYLCKFKLQSYKCPKCNVWNVFVTDGGRQAHTTEQNFNLFYLQQEFHSNIFCVSTH